MHLTEDTSNKREKNRENNEIDTIRYLIEETLCNLATRFLRSVEQHLFWPKKWGTLSSLRRASSFNLKCFKWYHHFRNSICFKAHQINFYQCMQLSLCLARNHRDELSTENCESYLIRDLKVLNSEWIRSDKNCFS